MLLNKELEVHKVQRKISYIHIILVVVYSSLLPMSKNLDQILFAYTNMKYIVTTISAFITLPFIPLGYLGGTIFTKIFHTFDVFTIGLFLSILIQVLLLMKFVFRDKSSQIDKPKRNFFVWSK